MNTPESNREAAPPADAALQAAAEAWVKRRAAGLSADERDAFRAWLKEDPRHPRAFAAANPAGDTLDWPLHTGVLDDVLAGLEQRSQKRRRRRRVVAVAGAAAALILAMVATPNLRRAPTPAAAETRATPSRLVIVQAHRQTLPDGSIVELKEGASIQVAYTDAFRRITLEQGEAHFEVAKNPARPFIVRAGLAEVRAVGTAFLVQVDPSRAELIVTEGRVALTAADSSGPAEAARPSAAVETEVGVGQRAIIDSRGGNNPRIPIVETVPAAQLETRMTWRVPRLEFAGTPLGEVAAMLNHYAATQHHPPRIIVAPELANLQVSGALRADKVDALVAMLESDFPVRAERRADGTVELRPRK